MLEKYLIELGLTEKEALVYLALLAVEHTSVIEISKKTHINRSTVYVTIDGLLKKGLVSEVAIGKKTHYHAEPPERLETYIQRQKTLIDERERRLKDIIPQIKSVEREVGTRPVVRYFEGKEGIVTANKEIYEGKMDNSPLYMIYSRDMVSSIFSDTERKLFRSNRIKNKIISKVIYTSSNDEPKDNPGENTGDRVRIDEKKYPFSCDIAIYQDKVRISILGKKLSGIFIKSKEFSDTLKNFFNLTFDQLKNPPKR